MPDRLCRCDRVPNYLTPQVMNQCVGKSFRSRLKIKQQTILWLNRHQPMRPMWRCRVCAAPWPCQPARISLLNQYNRRLVDLCQYLAGQYLKAIEDLIRVNPNHLPSNLHLRFLGWPTRTVHQRTHHQVSLTLDGSQSISRQPEDKPSRDLRPPRTSTSQIR